MSDLNMSHGKILDFIAFPLFRFTLVIKLKNFDFQSPAKRQYFLKEMMSDLIMPCQTVSDLV